jgi:predicted ester cyclase
MALSERKTKIEQIYKDIWTYWSESKANDLRSMVATDFICHVPDYDFKGIEEYCQLMTWYKGHFTNPEYTLNDLIEGENKVVARHTVYTSYVGGWHDIPPSDKRIKETGINIFYFNDDDLIQEMWCEMSDLSVYHQLKPIK